MDVKSFVYTSDTDELYKFIKDCGNFKGYTKESLEEHIDKHGFKLRTRKGLEEVEFGDVIIVKDGVTELIKSEKEKREYPKLRYGDLAVGQCFIMYPRSGTLPYYCKVVAQSKISNNRSLTSILRVHCDEKGWGSINVWHMYSSYDFLLGYDNDLITEEAFLERLKEEQDNFERLADL